MRKAFVFSFLLMLAPVAFGQNWFAGSLDQALAQAQKQNKLVLIEFASAG